MNTFDKAFKVWREFDNGMLTDPELLRVVESALLEAWSEGYRDGCEDQAFADKANDENYVAGDEFEQHDPFDFSENYNLTEMGEDVVFSLPRTNG
jgi:hypothetical protein